MIRLLPACLAALLLIGCGGQAEERRRQLDAERARRKAEKEELQRELERKRVEKADAVRNAIQALGARPAFEEVRKACEPGLIANVLDVHPEVAEACAGAYLESARREIRKRQFSRAAVFLDQLRHTGVESPEVIRVKDELANLVERDTARRRLLAAVDARKAYAVQLREHFLDEGLDIKVTVAGKQNERLRLTFVLFNDVWLHNFKKRSLIGEIRNRGFKRVDLSDGYDWGYYFTFEN